MSPITPAFRLVTSERAAPAAVRRRRQTTSMSDRNRRRGGAGRSTSPQSDPHFELAAIVARIPLDEAAREIAEYLRSEIAAYERLPATSRQQLVGGIERILRRCHGWLSTGVALQDSDFEALRQEARARATGGIRLEDLQRACGLGGEFILQLIRRYARSGEFDTVLEAGELVLQYVGQVSAVFADVYLAEREGLVSEDERRMRDLLDLLTANTALDAEDREIAHRAGIPIAAAYTPFAVVLPGRSPRRHANMAARLRRYGCGLAVTESERVVGLSWRPLDVMDLGEGSDVLLAIGAPTSREELTAAQDDLVLLVDDACRRGVRGRVELADHLLELVALRSPRATARLRESLLAPLTEPAHKQLLETLNTLFAHRLDHSATCAALYIHKNTLAYRLRRIAQIAGIDLQDPRDVARVYLAMATSE